MHMWIKKAWIVIEAHRSPWSELSLSRVKYYWRGGVNNIMSRGPSWERWSLSHSLGLVHKTKCRGKDKNGRQSQCDILWQVPTTILHIEVLIFNEVLIPQLEIETTRNIVHKTIIKFFNQTGIKQPPHPHPHTHTHTHPN